MVIPIRIKYGKKLELMTDFGLSKSLTHRESLEHARNVAKQIGWELAPSTAPENVIAYAPEPPVLDQIVDLFLLRGKRTSFVLTVDKASYSKLNITIFVAQPKPLCEDQTTQVITLVLQKFAREFRNDGVALTWVYFDKVAFQRDLEESTKRAGHPEILGNLSKYESRISFD